MTPPEKQDEDFCLEGCIGISESAALKNYLIKRIDNGNYEALDFSRVEHLDTAALQVVISFLTTLKNNNRTIELIGTGDSLFPAARLAGLEGHINQVTEQS